MAAAEESGTTTEFIISETTTIDSDLDDLDDVNDVDEVDSKVEKQFDQVVSESEIVNTAKHLIKIFPNIHRVKNSEIESHVTILVGNLVIPLCKEGQYMILENLLNIHIGTLKLPEHVGITKENLEKIANILARNTSITKLVLSFNNIGDVGIGLFAIHLARNNTIKMLDFSYNHITDTGAILLAAALSKNSSIMMIDLSGNNITDAGKSALAAVSVIRPDLQNYF